MKIPFVIHVSAQKAPIRKINKYIEIVASDNLRLTAIDRNSRANMLPTLRQHYRKVGVTIIDSVADLEKLVAKKPDLVVLGMKFILLDPSKGYDDSPKVWLSSYLQEHGVTFTGSDAAALALEFDKPKAKQAVMDAGLQSSAYFISSIKQPMLSHNLRYPLFVKPANLGGSEGIDEMSVVHSQAELERKIAAIHNECGSDVLVEEYLSGREFSVAVIKKAGKLLAMPIEITTPTDKKGNSFLSEAVKHADTEKVSAVNDATLKQALNTLAIGVFEALGSRDYGRIDMRLDGSGVPNFIEANLTPGLSNHGYLSRCFALNEATAYEDMILSIAALGFRRAHTVPSKAIPVVAQVPEDLTASRLVAAGTVLR